MNDKRKWKRWRFAIAIVVVVGILAAILVVAVPAFVTYRNTGARDACIRNLRMIEDGKRQWKSQHSTSVGKLEDGNANQAAEATNKARVVTTEVFTRVGDTNLVRRAYCQNGKVGLVRQQVYRGTNVVFEMWQTDSGLTCSAKPVADVDVGTHFTPEGKLDNVNLMTKDLLTVDHFTVTNGLLYPISTADINKANDVGRDVGALIRNITNTTPEAFGEQAIELIKKHKTE